VLNSTVLEVAIGLLFCYGSMALIASSVYEAIASLLKLRARSLLDGVKSLLNDQTFSGLALNVYNHALVNPRDDGAAKPGEPPRMRPSYIEPRAFAIALIDSVAGVSATFGQLKTKIDGLPDGQIRTLLEGMYTRADGSLENLHAAVAGWFDAGMDRVSGGYKRQAQLCTFIIALAIAGLINVDTFHLFATLWNHPALAAKLSAGADATQDAFKNLELLPVGWTTDARAAFSLVTIAGWIITALSALFGAPFWFDLLQRLVNLRGTGSKPAR
jgi:hypothetical protein